MYVCTFLELSDDTVVETSVDNLKRQNSKACCAAVFVCMCERCIQDEDKL